MTRLLFNLRRQGQPELARRFHAIHGYLCVSVFPAAVKRPHGEMNRADANVAAYAKVALDDCWSTGVELNDEPHK